MHLNHSEKKNLWRAHFSVLNVGCGQFFFCIILMIIENVMWWCMVCRDLYKKSLSRLNCRYFCEVHSLVFLNIFLVISFFYQVFFTQINLNSSIQKLFIEGHVINSFLYTEQRLFFGPDEIVNFPVIKTHSIVPNYKLKTFF